MSSNTNCTDIHESFLTLVRLGIGTSKDAKITNDVDWDEQKALAEQHGLLGVVLDGIEQLKVKSEELRVNLPEKILLAQWIGEVSQFYEQRYEQYLHAIADLAAFYNYHGYKMMVLKGFACSLNWPKPEHRPCGDIDIWQFGQQKEADAALIMEKRLEIVSSHHHHTIFYWHDFMAENHYDFINVHHHKSNAEVEKVLKELGSEANLNHNENDNHNGNRIPCVEVYGEKVYLPSANLHALFLLKHTMIHFAAEGISLRQLLDWGFFIQAHHQEIDWPWFFEKLERFEMTNMFNIFNAICVEDLGFDAAVFHQVQFNPFVKDRVLKEILEPEFGEELPKKLIPRMVFKYRRWKGSAWKHELCYKESMWSAFWSGIWNHILKPSSI